MQSNREIIIKALALASMKVKVVGTWTNGVIEEQFGHVADEILSVMQPNSDIAPPLQQAGVSGGRQADSLPAHCKDHRRGKDDECKYPVGSCEQCRQ